MLKSGFVIAYNIVLSSNLGKFLFSDFLRSTSIAMDEHNLLNSENCQSYEAFDIVIVI